MKISVVDTGEGIMAQFASNIGAVTNGRFITIPESRGAGYLTGFSWGKDLRMLIRNYYLNEEVSIERINEFAEDEDSVVFMLSGVFSRPLLPERKLSPERAHVFICMHAVSSVVDMPSDTVFGSVTIAVSRQYLRELFGTIQHPLVESLLEAKNNFVFETGITPDIINTADGMLGQPVPESIEKHYFRLKCEELLCHIFAILMQREAIPASAMHIDDIKAIYAVRTRLQSHPDETPAIAALAKEAGMSEPKLRKLFKQTFGKGVFEYYQSVRIQEAARLLKEERLTVSEAGYSLGFTNLSHFSRVFQEHIGMKPKKYSLEG